MHFHPISNITVEPNETIKIKLDYGHMTNIDHFGVEKMGVKGPPILCSRNGSLGTITPLWYYIKMGVP